jgi:hypothetical protein
MKAALSQARGAVDPAGKSSNFQVDDLKSKSEKDSFLKQNRRSKFRKPFNDSLFFLNSCSKSKISPFLVLSNK